MTKHDVLLTGIAYGAAIGVVVAIVVMLLCIAIGQRLSLWRQRRRLRERYPR